MCTFSFPITSLPFTFYTYNIPTGETDDEDLAVGPPPPSQFRECPSPTLPPLPVAPLPVQ
ncbi:hypothetical protein GBAR_LOCUS27659, partial [Geodia barretti]